MPDNRAEGYADPRPKIATVWSAERRGVPIAREVIHAIVDVIYFVFPKP